LKAIQTKYPKLAIEKKPVFIIFDHKGIVLKTYNLQEAVDFLEEDYQSGTSN